jgi:polysaccharide export outer membrane protein
VADSPAPLLESVLESRTHRIPDAEHAQTSHRSLGNVVALVRRRRRFCLSILLITNLLCVIYCILAPNKYEASAKVALATQSASNLHIGAPESTIPISVLNAPLQLETLANELRGERLSWRVITGLKLYDSPAIGHVFRARFPDFDPSHPTPVEQNYLLDAFAKRLHVGTIPRTLLIEVGFRSHDPALSARVVNTLIQAFTAEEAESRAATIEEQSAWLQSQLNILTARVQGQEKELAAFERKHGFMTSQETVQGGQPMETLHNATLAEVDEAERLWLTASADRIFREALLNQARQGNPEQVLAANPQLQAEMGPAGASMAQELKTHQSEVAVELAQLRAEHGPNYPRVVELTRAGQEIDEQIKATDQSLLDSFERTWKAAQDREIMLRAQLDARTAEGLNKNDATIEYTVLHEQVQSGRELCNRLRQRMEEASLTAGIHTSAINVIDPAREPTKPVAPDPLIDMAISVFLSLWLAVGGAFLLDVWEPAVSAESKARFVARWRSLLVSIAALTVGISAAMGQAPTPNTQGLPSGVVKLPEDKPATVRPDARQAPPVWNATVPTSAQAFPESASPSTASAMALPIAAGDFLEVSEFHLAEFRSSLRVAADGTATLPLIGPIPLAGMNEQEAAHAIEKSLLTQGILLHPQVLVLVTSAAGQDVSVIGEVVRPGIYPFSMHHRLLDLIAAASGLSPNAGRLVSVFHRQDPATAHTVALDPSGSATNPSAASNEPEPSTAAAKAALPHPTHSTDRNPELEPGDTVLISRAGLVYVIGDVVRPGGFPVDPVQGLTVVQAVSLAWGASPNAASSKAILIRDQTGGRTLTTLNLHRMIRGQDPDIPIHDRDILFVPNSTAKNLMNKSLEAAIQSAIGVSIYAGLVYSQRF